MTTIKYQRSGGVIGNEIQLELDLNTLPDDEAQRLVQMITDADFFNIPEDLGAHATPDEFQYVITVHAGRSSHTVHVTDTTMPLNLIPLVKELTILRVLQ